MKAVQKSVQNIFLAFTRDHLERWADSESARTGKKIIITDKMWKDFKENGIRYDDENAFSDILRDVMAAWHEDYQKPNPEKRCSVSYCDRTRYENKTCCSSCILGGKGQLGEDM